MTGKPENIIVGTYEMMEAALAEVQEMIRLGTFPKPRSDGRIVRVRARKPAASAKRIGTTGDMRLARMQSAASVKAAE